MHTLPLDLRRAELGRAIQLPLLPPDSRCFFDAGDRDARERSVSLEELVDPTTHSEPGTHTRRSVTNMDGAIGVVDL